MILEKAKFNKLFSLVFLILLFSGCNSNEKSVIDHYYLLLIGESQTWNLNGYEIMITSDSFKVGNGTLRMKNANKYISDSFQFETHAVINGEDTVVHAGSATGAGIDISKKTTGANEGGTYFKKNGEPITLNEVSDIYMVVEWWDIGKNVNLKERLDLYSKNSKEKTFLN